MLEQQSRFNSLVVQLLNGFLDESARLYAHLRELSTATLRHTQAHRLGLLVMGPPRDAGALVSTLIREEPLPPDLVHVTATAGQSFLDRMIALVEGAARQRTPNEIALSLVLSAFTLIFLIVTAALWPMAAHTEAYMKDFLGAEVKSLGTDVPTHIKRLASYTTHRP